MRGPLERGRRRTRQDQISPGTLGPREKLRSLDELRTERRKPVSSAGPVLERANPFQKAIQPFDLMSRRHPLSSTGATPVRTCLVKRQIDLEAQATRRHQAAGILSTGESYFFFFATLRV